MEPRKSPPRRLRVELDYRIAASDRSRVKFELWQVADSPDETGAKMTSCTVRGGYIVYGYTYESVDCCQQPVCIG